MPLPAEVLDCIQILQSAMTDAWNAQIEEPGSKEETAPSHWQPLAAYAHNESEQRMLMGSDRQSP